MLRNGLAPVVSKNTTAIIFASTWFSQLILLRSFWREVIRRRALPIYQHPALVAKGSTNGRAYIEPDGSISDGDDHIWSGDHNILKGGGEWQKTFNEAEMAKVSGEHQRESPVTSLP